MPKQKFPKSKYSHYKGKKLLKLLSKDFGKIFIPLGIFIPLLIYFNDVEVRINEVPTGPLEGALTSLLVIMGFWLFFSFFAFIIFSISNSKNIE